MDGYKTKWVMYFETLKGRRCEVRIEERGWKGSFTELEGSESPIETEEDSGEELMQAVRAQTGYLRVVDNGDIEGLLPVDNREHYVELYVEDELKWLGFMQADTYSGDWDVPPLEAEFPLLSPVGMLGGVYIDQSKDMGLVSLAELLTEAMGETGVAYDWIYFPREVTWSATSGYYLAPFALRVSRFNFFTLNDSDTREDADWMRYDGETYGTFLEEFCKFWGWTLHERGRDLVFTMPGCDTYTRVSPAGLRSVFDSSVSAPGYPSLKSSVIYEDLLEWDGDSHTRDVLQGYERIGVTAKINPVGDVVPTVDKSALGRKGDLYLEYTTGTGYVYAYEKTKLYGGGDETTDVRFYSYIQEDATLNWKQVPFNAQVSPYRVGAALVEYDRFKKEELAEKKNFDYKEGIYINLQDTTGMYPTVEQARRMPVVVMRSGRTADYRSGAFVLSAQTSSLKDPFGGLLDESDGYGTLELSFRVGTKYWSGSGWATGQRWFTVQLAQPDGKPGGLGTTGVIVSNKTIAMPYNGATGYVMSINTELSGEVELLIHAVRNDGGYAKLYLDDLRIAYYKDDSVESSTQEQNRYSAVTGKGFNQEQDIELMMATDNNNQAGYGILSYPGRDVSKLWFVSRKWSMRPELRLLELLKKAYGNTTEKLTLELEQSDRMDVKGALMLGDARWCVLSESVDWAQEHATYVIERTDSGEVETGGLQVTPTELSLKAAGGEATVYVTSRIAFAVT